MIALSLVLVTLQATGSRGAVDPLGRGSWLIDEENDEVLLAEPMQVLQRVKVDRWPEQLAVDAKGRVFVTCREGNALDVIGTDLTVRRFPVGPEPRALALDEEHGRVYVGTATGQSLHALTLDTLAPVAERKVEWPVAALAVTPAGLAAVSERIDEVWFFPLALGGAGKHRKLDGIKAEVQPQWLVPHGDDLLVVSRAVETGLDAPVSSGGYGGDVFGLHQLVVHALRGLSKSIPPAPFETAKLPDLPDASSVELFGSRLLISSRSAGLMMHVNADTLRGHVVYSLGDFPRFGEPDLVQSDSRTSAGVAAATFTATGDLLLVQPAPRALRWLRLPEPVPVDSRFPARDTGIVSAASRLPQSMLDPELRLGRALFHDATNERLSERRMACALCHLDGREDGLVWQQNGTFRQTPMLAGGRLKETAPYNWLGTAHTLEVNIKQTVTRRLGGDGLGRGELRALARYVREGLRPVQRPDTEHGALVAEGKAVFERADVGCASCHPADFAFTDGAQHDIASVGHDENAAFKGSHRPMPGALLMRGQSAAQIRLMLRPPRTPSRFNTPSLAFVGMTAPYLHDGSAPTLEALIDNNHDRMGTTSQLSLAEREALVAYLQSL